MTYKLFTDGGARGNPGPTGLGAIIFKSDWILLDLENKFIKEATNNVAEYSALIMGLELAKKHDVDKLTCYLDSELVVKQLKGEYKVKNEVMKEYKEKVDTLIREFSFIEFKHVTRDKNKFADKLVNLALDNILKQQ